MPLGGICKEKKSTGVDPCSGSEWVESQPAHPSLGFCTEQTNTYPTGKPTGARGVLEKPPLHSQGVCSAACQPRGQREPCLGLPPCCAYQPRSWPTPHHAWGKIMVKTRSSYAETGKVSGSWSGWRHGVHRQCVGQCRKNMQWPSTKLWAPWERTHLAIWGQPWRVWGVGPVRSQWPLSAPP